MNVLTNVWFDRAVLAACAGLLIYAGTRKRAGLFWVGVIVAITFGSVPH